MDCFIERVALGFFILQAKSSHSNCLDSQWSCSQMALSSFKIASFNLSFLYKVFWWFNLPNSAKHPRPLQHHIFNTSPTLYYRPPIINWQYLSLQLFLLKLHSRGETTIYDLVCSNDAFIFN